ncbi:helix-turn-helix transcriptional regulator [Paenibacillus sp. M1]|uniref:Helix-turn-helix transcriptional regulator n=1 Tax=Paenibacillus haidiansis TaxID=1574488 RepID=A0ABU7VSW0_9BACL
MKIGDQIEALMKKNKITRLKLSKDTDIPYTTLTQIINGRTKNPQVNALKIIADYFNVSLDYILGKSPKAIIEQRMAELNMTIDELSEKTGLPKNTLENLDTYIHRDEDFKEGGLIVQLVEALSIDPNILVMAFMRQANQLNGTFEKNEKRKLAALEHSEVDLSEEEILTLAAHQVGHDGPLTEEQLAQIKLAMKIALAKNDK